MFEAVFFLLLVCDLKKYKNTIGSVTAEIVGTLSFYGGWGGVCKAIFVSNPT